MRNSQTTTPRSNLMMALRLALVSTGIVMIAMLSMDAYRILGILFAAFLVWVCRVECIPALMILFVSPSDLLFLKPLLPSFSNIMPGFEPRIAVAFLAPLVLLKRRSPIILKWLCVTMLVATILGAFSTYLGYQVRYPNWTRGLRFAEVLFSFYFGSSLVLLSKKSRSAEAALLLLTPMSILLLMNVFNLFHNHLEFVLVASTVVSAHLHYLAGRRWLALIVVAIPLLYISVNEPSLTTFAIFVLTCISVILVHQRARLSHAFILAFIIALPLTLTAYVLITGEKYYAQFATGTTLTERLMFKLFSDRFPLWEASWRQVYSSDRLVLPSGTPVQLILNNDWVFGSHNTVLELLRSSGVLPAFVILVSAGVILVLLLWGISASRNQGMKSIGSMVIVIAGVGMATGDFPMDSVVGFWLWSLAGMVYTAFYLESPSKPLPSGSRVRGRF